MVEEFSVGNFFSIKDVQTLNLKAAKIKSKNTQLDLNNVINLDNKISFLKAKAIYGANASGKSNIIIALSVFIRIIYFSAKDEKLLELVEPFLLNSETRKRPTFFQIVFRINKIRYRYGFEVDKSSLKSEWLFSTPNKREQALFIRENNELIEVNQTHFEEGVIYQKLFKNSESPIFTDTSLFLTHLAQTGFGKISKLILSYITSITIMPGLGHPGMLRNAIEALNVPNEKQFILDFLQKADVSIENLEVVDMTNGMQATATDIKSKRESQSNKTIESTKLSYNSDLKQDGNVKFSFFRQESEGTKKMLELSPYIYKSLKEGTPLLIDEFDARFHPLLTKKIVELFNSHNNKNAQLVFVTHDTNLLSASLLRRDQIDFVEKDKYGASHLYTLIEIKGVRNDASFEKDYIQGKYGAIPYLGDFENLILD